ncbi:hypothetical protein HGRIS_005053 [Hohenbuehelia grisea]|uniref:Phosphatidic acid phosphatase type 2/haloperoxidase domain-containing protein n=1 Tax=Hohenbuehelia grisea TaxID=104357 RepID=A0ABR3JDV5_9AGAR
MTHSQGPQASLDLTHVLYDDSSLFSLALALLTLSPILLMAAYAVLVVQTRELTILIMWAGQLACEGFNWIIKRAIKEDRPNDLVGNGYGFPSSHSQYMGYFASFLICHLYFRHRFGSMGYPFLDQAWRGIVYLALVSWASIVAYSRLHLGYHSEHQVLWGAGIGVTFGLTLYLLAELIPVRHPQSPLGKFRAYLLTNPISTWIRLRDGWAIWPDAGQEEEWQRWRAQWDKRRTSAEHKRSQ